MNETIPEELPLPTTQIRTRQRKEKQLYEPILNALKEVFERYLESEKQRREITSDFKGIAHLEITANGRFSNELKEVLDDKALSIVRVEKFSPDIMGFIQKNQYSKEIITVEVKAEEIKIKNISRAKLYADIFGATYGKLISPKPIPEEIRRFITDRYAIRGNLIIAQFDKTRKGYFNFNQKLYSTIPEPFQSFRSTS
jgi:hypothetical protein